MSTSNFIKELPHLNEAQLRRALELTAKIDALQSELQELIRTSETDTGEIDLQARGISKGQAAELRARLKAFGEDWDRPEAAIYDEDQPR